jgi:uncharacterized protein DUF2272
MIPDDELNPAPAPTSEPSPFARKLAVVAQDQHGLFRFVNEADPQLCGAIKQWTEDIGGTFVSCTSNQHPWSAVFVSWCVKTAGATASEFKFSKRHSVYVHAAIQNAISATGRVPWSGHQRPRTERGRYHSAQSRRRQLQLRSCEDAYPIQLARGDRGRDRARRRGSVPLLHRRE